MAAVVLVASEVAYRRVVRHAHAGIGPGDWRSVRIHAKQTTARAWVHLPGLVTQPNLPAVLVASSVGPASRPIPRELPRPTADFTGRSSAQAVLRRLLDPESDAAARARQPVVISAIDGMGGVGKSALAIQVAHQLAHAFPDGQLYINLQGATPGLKPLAPLEVLGRLLRSLGMDPPPSPPMSMRPPPGSGHWPPSGGYCWYWTVPTAQSRSVRCYPPANLWVLITSRQILATLEGTQALHLDLLPSEQALANRLADATHRLRELTAGQLAVRACFDISLQALEESADPIDHAAAAAFELLGLSDGPDTDRLVSG